MLSRLVKAAIIAGVLALVIDSLPDIKAVPRNSRHVRPSGVGIRPR